MYAALDALKQEQDEGTLAAALRAAQSEIKNIEQHTQGIVVDVELETEADLPHPAPHALALEKGHIAAMAEDAVEMQEGMQR